VCKIGHSQTVGCEGMGMCADSVQVSAQILKMCIQKYEVKLSLSPSVEGQWANNLSESDLCFCTVCVCVC
jgi:hypothetical protein